VACLLLCQARPVPLGTASDSGATAADSRSSNPCVQAPGGHDASASIAISDEYGVLTTPAGRRSDALCHAPGAAKSHILRATCVVPRAHHDPHLVEASARAYSLGHNVQPTVKHRRAGGTLRALLQFSTNGAFPDLGPGFPDLNSLLGPGFGAALSASPPPPGARSAAWAALRSGT